jgi:hypothetical protein
MLGPDSGCMVFGSQNLTEDQENLHESSVASVDSQGTSEGGFSSEV